MRVIVIDDEPLARRGIRNRLSAEPDMDIVAECCDGKSAIAAIRAHAPELIFLDVQMPDMSGFDVLRSLLPNEIPFVIFVTAYDRYALDAFKIHALDYLLKPLDDQRFVQSLQHVRNQISDRGIPDLEKRILKLLDHTGNAKAKDRYEKRFSVKTGQRIAIVAVADIDWLEATGDYVTLHAGKKSHLLRVTMNRVETQLDPEHFIRIHRSAIIRASRISELISLDNREFTVRLSDGTELKVSRTYSDRIERWL